MKKLSYVKSEELTLLDSLYDILCDCMNESTYGSFIYNVYADCLDDISDCIVSVLKINQADYVKPVPKSIQEKGTKKFLEQIKNLPHA